MLLKKIIRFGGIALVLFMLVLVGINFSGPNIQLSFKPISAFAQYTRFVIEKRCSNCGRVVPNSSHAGQCCPYCGAYWGYETNTGLITESESDGITGETVTVHVGQESFATDYRLKNDSILVPVRFFSENLGFVVIWTPPDSIEITGSNRTIFLKIGEQTVSIEENGTVREIELALAPEIRADSTYIPLRSCAEILGYTVEFKSENGGEVYLYMVSSNSESNFLQ